MKSIEVDLHLKTFLISTDQYKEFYHEIKSQHHPFGGLIDSLSNAFIWENSTLGSTYWARVSHAYEEFKLHSPRGNIEYNGTILNISLHNQLVELNILDKFVINCIKFNQGNSQNKCIKYLADGFLWTGSIEGHIFWRDIVFNLEGEL